MVKTSQSRPLSTPKVPIIAVMGLMLIAYTLCCRGDILSSNIYVSPPFFNAQRGERTTVRLNVSVSNQCNVSIFDCDGGLVRKLSGEVHAPDMYELVWDGKDLEGRVVPDEAYVFLIEWGNGAMIDPTLASGGEVNDIKAIDSDKNQETLSYALPTAARVLIRLGIKNGPMHRTLVDWKPRPAGAVTEYWDGMDENKVFNLRDHKDFSGIITYVTLPMATVITHGNTNETYREYKLGRGKDRPLKPKRERKVDSQLRSPPEGLVPPAWARTPQVSLSFPKDTNSPIPETSGSIDVRVDVAETDKDDLLKGQFEVMFFVDNVFFAEAERGYVPYNWKWELQQVPPGEHLLTVNVSSLKGQVGAASRKIKVPKPAAN